MFSRLGRRGATSPCFTLQKAEPWRHKKKRAMLNSNLMFSKVGMCQDSIPTKWPQICPPHPRGGKCTENQGKKKLGNGNVQANVRANNSGQFEGTAHENVGFRGKRARKFTQTSPRTLPWNFITMLSARPRKGINLQNWHPSLMNKPFCSKELGLRLSSGKGHPPSGLQKSTLCSKEVVLWRLTWEKDTLPQLWSSKTELFVLLILRPLLEKTF